MGKLFGRLLRTWRAERGLSGKRLGELSGIGQGNTAAIERGDRRASDANLAALAGVEALGLGMAKLRAWRAADDIEADLPLLVAEAPELLGLPPAAARTTAREPMPAYATADDPTGGGRPLTAKEQAAVARLRAGAAGDLAALGLGPDAYVWALPPGERLRALLTALADLPPDAGALPERA